MRKHHNKLYYSKYKVKTVFKLPGSLMFYPTTDQYLTSLKEQHPELPALNFLADFIIKNRNSMRFRIQDKKAIFYSDKERSDVLIDFFKKYWQKTEIVDPKYDMLSKDVIGCTKLPHGRFKYQIHLKKDAHKHISQSERQALWNLIERNEESEKNGHIKCRVPQGFNSFCYKTPITEGTNDFSNLVDVPDMPIIPTVSECKHPSCKVIKVIGTEKKYKMRKCTMTYNERGETVMNVFKRQLQNCRILYHGEFGDEIRKSDYTTGFKTLAEWAKEGKDWCE